jgi:hypothetical protein
MNATWPFARLTVEPGGLTLSTTFYGTFSFEKNQITKLSKYGFIPFFATGLRIEHSVAGCPPFIVFWTLGPFNAVKAGLIEQGYEVG